MKPQSLRRFGGLPQVRQPPSSPAMCAADTRSASSRFYFEWALGSFGEERLIFGSDWPVCLLAAGYEPVFETARQLLADRSEAVFGANAAPRPRIGGQAGMTRYGMTLMLVDDLE